MRAFRFRPEALLELRRREEDRARDVLARARTAQDQADARAAVAAAAVLDAARTLGRVQADGATAQHLAWHRSWIAHLRGAAEARRTTAAQAAGVVAQAGAVVRTAVQRRRVLERLRERAWRRHQQEIARAHAREMDSVGMTRYFARLAEAGGADEHDFQRDPDAAQRGQHRQPD